MDIVFTSLEALIQRATNASLTCPEPAAVEAFCAILSDSTDGPFIASKVLAARIQSQNPTESLLALSVLDRCMRKCDVNFHAEVGKFRFLNEMIKLVSPKYYANRTSPAVQQKVIQLLHAWAIEYPRETKFKVAFDMLKNQGVVKETPPPLPPDGMLTFLPPRSRPSIIPDEERSRTLQKLLQSKNPEDLQAANRLIKNMVREDERRTEASSRRALELSSAVDSAQLLGEMLEHVEEAGIAERQLIRELRAACIRHLPSLQCLASLAAQQNDEQAIHDILHASDELSLVIKKYDEVMCTQRRHVNILSENIVPSTPTAGKASTEASLLDLNNLNAQGSEIPNSIQTFDSLGDIFSSIDTLTPSEIQLLKPVNIFTGAEPKCEESSVEGLATLDQLGVDLLRQSLPDHTKSLEYFNKSSKKIPMNALEKTSKDNPNLNPSKDDDNLLHNTFDLNFLVSKTMDVVKVSDEVEESTSHFNNDDLMVDISMELISDLGTKRNSNFGIDVNCLPQNVSEEIKENSQISLIESQIDDADVNKIITNNDNFNTKSACDTNSKPIEVPPLTDINVTLESIRPSKRPPLIVYEEENSLTIVLHLSRDKPRKDVSVFVVTTTSRNTSQIDDYKIQAIVPKGCKVKVLPPSATWIPALNHFMPPPAITQVMLIAKPDSVTDLTLKFVITFSCNGETFTELAELQRLPLDEEFSP